VYKVKECEPRFPGGTLKIAEHTPPPYHVDLEWQTYVEPKCGPDDFLEKIVEQVKIGKSFTVLGPPGTGKTWILAKVKECLEELGQRVACLAPTHQAARLLPEGNTVHHFIGKYALTGTFKGYILLDEVSMCCLPLFAALDHLRLLGTKIITFGDWDPLPPVGNSWRGEPISPTAFKKSRLYKVWSDCTCFELTRCRRSDKQHFNFYTGLLEDNLPQAIAKTRKRYRAPKGTQADLHICISHWKRRKISQARQEQAAIGKKCVPIPKGDDPAFSCFVGTKLVGSSTYGKFVNGGRYKVVCLNPLRVEDDAGVTFDTTAEQISKHCMLAFALVYPKVQGITELGTVMLHDLDSKFFQKNHLYVGLSRVTTGCNVYVE